MGGGTGDGAASYMKNPISGSALSYMILPLGEDKMRWNCTLKLHLTRHLAINDTKISQQLTYEPAKQSFLICSSRHLSLTSCFWNCSSSLFLRRTTVSILTFSFGTYISKHNGTKTPFARRKRRRVHDPGRTSKDEETKNRYQSCSPEIAASRAQR